MAKPEPKAGTVEREYGIPIPGKILPREAWAQTAYKQFPPPAEAPLDFAEIFGRTAPLVIDLGCGNGRYVLQSALARSDHDHFACDLLPAAIRYATRRANQRGLGNVRFAVKDAESFVRDWIAPGAASEVHCYHPQPYHDAKERWRRLLMPVFLKQVHRALAPGGLFVVQTDCPPYWAYMKEVLPALFEFHEQDGPWPDASQGRSRREILARKRGYAVFRGYGYKLDLPDAELDARVAALPLPNFKTRGVGSELDEEEETIE